MLLNTFFLLKCLNRSLLYKLQYLNSPVSVARSRAHTHIHTLLTTLCRSSLLHRVFWPHLWQRIKKTCKMLMKHMKSFDSLILMRFLFRYFPLPSRLSHRFVERKTDRVNENYFFITSKLSNMLINFRALDRAQCDFFFVASFEPKRRVKENERRMNAMSFSEGFCSNILD